MIVSPQAESTWEDFTLDDEGSPKSGHWLRSTGPVALVTVPSEFLLRADLEFDKGTKIVPMSNLSSAEKQMLTKQLDMPHQIGYVDLDKCSYILAK